MCPTTDRETSTPSADPAKKLIQEVWDVVPRILTAEEAMKYTEEIDPNLFPMHGRHLAQLKRAKHRDSFSEERHHAIGEAAALLMHNVLKRCTETRDSAKLLFWEEPQKMSVGRLTFDFEKSGNISIRDAHRWGEKKCAEFDACLLNKHGSLCFIDVTASERALKKKYDLHHQRDVGNVLRLIQRECNSVASLIHLYIADTHSWPRKGDSLELNTGVWRACTLIESIATNLNDIANHS